jgi:hypothetical protein
MFRLEFVDIIKGHQVVSVSREPRLELLCRKERCRWY